MKYATPSPLLLPANVFAYRFSLRKRAIIRRFISHAKVHFIQHAQHLLPESTLLLWGSHPLPPNLTRDIHIIRIEDGFLRSVGLGADLIPPISWVIDQRGIYYDATRPSDLEHLLQTSQFDSELLERAILLRQRIVATGLTKYNVGSESWHRPSSYKRIILVPGQVETDASIRFGTPGISSNIGLLQAVRAAHPDAYIVYKPHPDVVAGLRIAGQKEDQAQYWCNEIVDDVAIGKMLSVIDEVHVLTSLTGFEALLRGKQVICYGQPFYAGWGLTIDKFPIDRRTRRLSLDALVAGALILYPTYISRNKKGGLITPEQVLDELSNWYAITTKSTSLWRKALRMILRIIKNK